MALEKGRIHVPDDANSPRLPLNGDTFANVPTFTCLVYVTETDSSVSARVANLELPTCEGSSEREVLSKIIPLFKQRVQELLTSNQSIEWIDPPAALEPGEQKRIVPVHL